MRRFVAVFIAAVLALASRAGAFVDGSNVSCVDFELALLQLGDPDTDGFIDLSNEGWVWVNNSQSGFPRLRSVSGLVLESNVASNDNPQDHDSHDVAMHVFVDDGQQDALSNVNDPNEEDDDFVDLSELLTPRQIELEWEMGTYPSERGQSVPQRFFPRWAWPNVHDRVWADGNLVFDCGHAKNQVTHYTDPNTGITFTLKTPYYRSEIHPPRAIATMRDQAHTLPSTGATPVPVTATDLYIHGLAGAVTDVLQCGMIELVEPGEGNCTIGHPNHRGTAIDTQYAFDVCLPPRPSDSARLDSSVEVGPGNTITGRAPTISTIVPPAACANNAWEEMDTHTALHVVVDLSGSGATPADTYARKIYAGWVAPPSPPLQHLAVGLGRMDLHLTEDPNTFCSEDSELSFMWANIAAAPQDEWIRLADYAPPSGSSSVMSDYGASFALLSPQSWDDHSYVDFTGAGWGFYVRNGEDFTLRAQGYDEDCYDDYFGEHRFVRLAPQFVCNAFAPCETGTDDPVDRLEAEFLAPDYGIDPTTGHGDRLIQTELHRFIFPLDPQIHVDVAQYAFDATIDRIPLADEDRADLRVTKTCIPSSGTSFTCTMTVRNTGPGLPRDVVLTDQLTTDAAANTFTVSTPTFRLDQDPSTTANCTLTSPTAFTCAIGTVSIGGRADVTVLVTTTAPASFDDTATVTTASTDPVSSNNSAMAGLTVVAIDVQPPSPSPVAINVAKSGVVPVAVLTTPRFDARTVNFTSICFGSPTNAAARTCTEVHGTAHVLDVDKDRDLDMLLHYDVLRAGLRAGDTQACLTGRTMSGRTILGCDAIVAR